MALPGGELRRPLGPFLAPTCLSQAEVMSGELATGATVGQGRGGKKTLLGCLVLQEEEEEADMGHRCP